MKKNLIMKAKAFSLVVLLTCVLSMVVFGNTNQPDRFKIDFNKSYIVVNPGNLSMQAVAENSVLSYGEDWEIIKMKSYLYHMRQQNWKGFYWMVNTARKEVYKVVGNQFGTLGGNMDQLPVNVSVVGGANNSEPDRFFLYFSNSYLIFMPDTSTLQIAAEGMVISYGVDWVKVQMKPYLYQLKKNSWQGFYWQVNTSRKELYIVRNGQLGTFQGITELKQSPVIVYY